MTNHYLVRIKSSTGYTVHEETADSLSAAVAAADENGINGDLVIIQEATTGVDGVSDCHLLVQTYYISDPY